jgi:hypothetical protein
MMIINTNPGERVICKRSPYAYEFFVLFADNTSTLESACGMGGDKYDYALEIADYFTQTHGLPSFTREELADVKILIGDGKEALKRL